MKVDRLDSGLFLSQQCYATNLLLKGGLQDNKPSTNSMASKSYPPNAPHAFRDLTFYQTIVGSLLYLTFTKQDISFTVHVASQQMQSPFEFDFLQVMSILKYLKGTLERGHFITNQSDLTLTAYSDSE